MKRSHNILAVPLALLLPGCYTQIWHEPDERIAETRVEDSKQKVEPVKYVYIPQVHLVPIPGWDEEIAGPDLFPVDGATDNGTPEPQANPELSSQTAYDPLPPDIDQILNTQYLPDAVMVGRTTIISTTGSTSNANSVQASFSNQRTTTQSTSPGATRNSGTTRRRGR